MGNEENEVLLDHLDLLDLKVPEENVDKLVLQEREEHKEKAVHLAKMEDQAHKESVVKLEDLVLQVLGAHKDPKDQLAHWDLLDPVVNVVKLELLEHLELLVIF